MRYVLGYKNGTQYMWFSMLKDDVFEEVIKMFNNGSAFTYREITKE